jgi:hypothetical protein
MIGTVGLVFLLAAYALTVAAPAIAQEPPTSRQGYDISLAELLDENGRVVLPEGFSGSIDPGGFAMVSGEGETPRFVRAGRSNEQWSEGEFGEPGCSGGVNAAVVISGELFLGGSFQYCGFTPTSNITRFDPSSGEFSALGGGVNNTVWALAVIGDDLYVGGDFTLAGGEPASRIAVYDTTATGNAGWSLLGDGVNSRVYALAVIDSQLYVGGQFSEAGGAPANLVAVFDTTQTGNDGWSALGDGVNGEVRALAAVGADLYVGGEFNQAGGGAANRIAKFDTTQSGNAGWAALGDGVNSSVYALAAIDTDLYASGQFLLAGGATASRIAKFDTTQSGNAGWSTLGDGLNNIPFSLAAIGNHLYVGGFFTEAGGTATSNIAKFDTTQGGNAGWSALGDGVNSPVSALAAIGTDLYVGGGFTEAGDAVASRIAKFDIAQTGNAGWSVVGEAGGGLNGRVLAIAANGTDLYVGGRFTAAGGVAASRIAVYDTTTPGAAGWSALGDGVNAEVNALAVIGDDLYVGGLFTEAGDEPANHIAVYDTTQTGNAGWSALGDGTNLRVWAMAAIGTDLYVGGDFTFAGGEAAANVAVFNTTLSGNTGWSTLGDGVNNEVFALTAIGTDLYVGGGFTQAGGTPAGRRSGMD